MNDVKIHIDNFGFTPAASNFLYTLWDLIQFFDDVYDDDYINPSGIYDAVYKALVTFPSNTFYAANFATIAPAICLAIDKWKIANDMEKGNKGDARSFMWRAAYYDIFALVCVLEGKDTETALNLYGESYEDYLQEINNA